MKTLIQNKYIDFSIITHIEDMGDSLILNVFASTDKIKICMYKEDMDERFFVKTFTSVDSKKYTFAELFEVCLPSNERIGTDRYYFLRSEINDFNQKKEAEWQELKEKVVNIWKKTESSIKEIKMIQ